MSSNSGECFLILSPHTKNNCVIFGRNSLSEGENIQEVIYFPSVNEEIDIKCDGGALLNGSAPRAIIIVKNSLIWGGESGANDKNVCIGIAWSTVEPNENSLKSTDLVRLGLERSSSAEEAINVIGALNFEYGSDDAKFSFVICDSKEAWLLSIGGKLWAAERITSGYRAISYSGLAVTTKIDKSIIDLDDKLKDAGLWDGNEDLDFAKCFNSTSNEVNWPSEEPSDDGTFNLTNMFEILRSTEIDIALSSHVSTLVSSGISCHWFTATPNPRESVFKPFVFTPNARISPLTKVVNDKITMLHKLHCQRKWEKVGDLLKSLESTCVDEVNKFLNEHLEPNQELDDLMKDCVEAEVKFYR